VCVSELIPQLTIIDDYGWRMIKFGRRGRKETRGSLRIGMVDFVFDRGSSWVMESGEV